MSGLIRCVPCHSYECVPPIAVLFIGLSFCQIFPQVTRYRLFYKESLRQKGLQYGLYICKSVMSKQVAKRGTTDNNKPTYHAAQIETHSRNRNMHRQLNQTLTSINTAISHRVENCSTINSCDEESDSSNVLNMGFIADDSLLLFSNSQSVRSDAFSISDISAIPCRGNDPSPHFLVMQEQISGMEEWPAQKGSFKKKSYKRNNPAVEEEGERGNACNRCYKKKIDDKMRVVTIDPSSNKQKNDQPQTGYLLRSRMKKIVEKGKSSAQAIITAISSICSGQNKSGQT